jgi:hypothetical protein
LSSAQQNNFLCFIKRPGFIVLATFISATWVNFNIVFWSGDKVLEYDVSGYYSWLPSLFYHHDLSQKFLEKEENAYISSRYFSDTKAPNGNRIFKYSMGMGVTYLPFFTLAHLYCKITGAPTTGFSEPYQMAIQFSSLFYFLIGLIFLIKILRIYFDEIVVTLTLLFIVFGTNAFYYITIGGGMSHAVDFMLVCIFIWYSIQWHQNPSLKNTIILGLTGGFLTLIRPINILVFVFFALYKIISSETFKNKIKFFLSHWMKLFIMGTVVFLVFLPQLLYWKKYTGSWLFNSYVGEHFYFNHPHIFYGLFSYRKGWLVYTPIMLFALAGFYFLYRQRKEIFAGTLALLVFYIYVAFSWWCWWYGGSYGQRSLIDLYPFMALCLAAFLCYINQSDTFKKATIYTVIILLLLLNLFQTAQAKWNTIHYDSMTKDAYWDAFLRLTKNSEREKFLKHPDIEKAKAGLEEY